jgi:hypothetical protein
VARALDRFALPGPRTLLGIVLVARVALTTALITRASNSVLPFEGWLVGAIVGAAIAATVWLIIESRGGRVPGPTTLLLHATVDVLVVTGLVAFMTQSATPATPVAALYVALVTLYALLLPVGRGLIAVAFAVVCYVVIVLRSSLAPPGVEFWTQLGVIAFVGGMIAVLGNRLASAARERSSPG